MPDIPDRCRNCPQHVEGFGEGRYCECSHEATRDAVSAIWRWVRGLKFADVALIAAFLFLLWAIPHIVRASLGGS